MPECTRDVIFLVDSSSSVSDDGYQILKQFIKNVTDQFDYSKDELRVSIAQYTDDYELDWDLSKYVRDRDGLFSGIDGLQRRQGLTNTYTALMAVLDHQLNHEDLGRRADIPLVVVLLTDGRAKDMKEHDNALLKQKEMLRQTTVEGATYYTIAVGIQNADEAQLQELASDEVHKFKVDRMSNLAEIVIPVAESICVQAEIDRCVQMPSTDIVVILDATMDGEDTLPKYKKWLRELVEHFIIDDTQTQVGVVVVGEEVHTSAPHGIALGDANDVQDLINKIENLEPTTSGFNKDEFINKTLTEEFLDSISPRDTRRVIILITPEEVLSQLTPDLNPDTTYLVIAPSSDFDDYGFNGTSAPNDTYGLRSPDDRYDVQNDLSDFVDVLAPMLDKICIEEGVPTTGPGAPTTPEGVPTTEPGAPTTPEGVPTTGPAAPTTPEGVPTTGPGVPTTPEGVPTTGPGAPTVPEIVPTTVPGTPTTPEGVPTTGPGAPTTPEGVPTTGPGALTTPEGEPTTGPTEGTPPTVSTITETSAPTTMETTTPIPLCAIPSELVFVVDEAYLHKEPVPSTRQALTLFFQNALNGLDVSSSAVRVSIYSAGHDSIIPLVRYNQEQDSQSIISAFTANMEALGEVGDMESELVTAQIITDTLNEMHPGQNMKQAIVMLTQRKIASINNDIIRRLYENDVIVSVFADDEISAGHTARTLASNPKLYVPVLGLAELVDDGKMVVNTVCEDIPLHPPTVNLKCEGQLHSDIVFLIDRHSYVLNTSASVIDLSLQLTRALHIDNENIRVVTVFHSDVMEEPHVHIPTPDVTLEDVLWEAKRHSHEVDGKVKHHEETVDFGSTLEFMAREPLFSRRFDAASKVFVAISGRPIVVNDKTLKYLNIYDNENYTSVFASPNSDKLLSDERPQLNSVTFQGVSMPKQVFSATNDILDVICSTPRRPLKESICEAAVEVVFAADSSMFNSDKFRTVAKSFFKSSSILFGFDSARPLIMVGDSNVNLGTPYNIIPYPSDNELFPVAEVLAQASELFVEEAETTRRIIVLASLRSGDSSNVTEMRHQLQQQNISVIVLTIEQEFFLPSYEDPYKYTEIPVTEEDFLLDATASVVAVACAPYKPHPPVPPPEERLATCPTGAVTFLYDIALFSPKRDGRKVTLFMKKIMKLVGAASVHARATAFAGIGFGSTSDKEFDIQTNDLIGMAETIEILDKMEHDGIARTTPANAGKALNDTINDMAASAGETKYILLMIGRNSYDDLESAVSYAKKSGVDVITFYIGGLRFKPDEQMSTRDDGEIYVRRLYDLINLEYEMLEIFCELNVATTTTPTTIPPSIPPPRMECKVDLVLAVDDMFFQKKKNLQKLYVFLKNWIPLLAYGDGQTRVSLFRFGSKARNLYPGFIGHQGRLTKALQKNLKLYTATKGLSYKIGADRAIQIFNRNGREGDDVKRLLTFIVMRRGKVALKTKALQRIHDNNILFTSIVMEDAVYLQPNQLTNFNTVINVEKLEQLPYYTRQFASVVWNDLCENVGYPPTPPLEPRIPPSPEPYIPIYTCSVPLDVVIMIDRKMMEDVYLNEKVKAFLNTILLYMDLQTSKTRFAVVLYSTAPELLLDFSDSTASNARENINNLPVMIPAPNQVTLMYPALDYVTDTLLMTTDNRKSVPKVVLCLFDKESDDYDEALKEEILQLAYHNVPTFAINGDYSNERAKEMTEELCALAVQTTTTRIMPTTTLPQTTTAGEPTTELPVEPTTTTLAPIVPLTTLQPTTEYIPPVETTLPPQVVCEENSMDILMLIDVAGISKSNLDLLKQFLINVSVDVPFDGDGKSVSIVPYAAVPLSDGGSFTLKDLDELIVAIKNLKPQPPAILNTGKAILFALDQFREYGDKQSTWSLYIITDGRAKDNLSRAIDELEFTKNHHICGFDVGALGIGAANETQLKKITNETIVITDHKDLTNKTVEEGVKSRFKNRTHETSTTTISPSRTSTSPDLCVCYWTEYRSEDTPTQDSMGDMELWADSSIEYDGVCRDGYQGYDIKCKSDVGVMQDNVICHPYFPLMCFHLDVPFRQGLWCHDYSASIQCCSSACGEPTIPPLPKIKEEPEPCDCHIVYDLVTLIDTATDSEDDIRQMANFAYKLQKDMKVENNCSRGSVVTYDNDGAEIVIDFTNNVTKIGEALIKLRPSAPLPSDVSKGLKVVKDNMVRNVRSITEDGRIVQKAIVVIANTHSTGVVENLVDELHEKHKFGIATVGINDVRENLLDRISTFGDEGVFQPESLDLQKTAFNVSKLFCVSKPRTSTTAPSPSTTPEGVPPTKETTTPEGVPPTEKTTTPEVITTTSVITTTPELSTTTEPTKVCEFFNETSAATTMLEPHQVVHPDPNNMCKYYECQEDGSINFHNKRLLCEKKKRPMCDNGFEPVLYLDEDCNCQWECQCYCVVGGDSAYHTFDGDYYSLPPPPNPKCGERILFKSTDVIKDERSTFRVTHTVEACEVDSSSACVASVKLIKGGKTYRMRKDLTVTVNDYPVELPYGEGVASSQMKIVKVGLHALYLSSSEIGLEIEFSPKEHIIAASLPAYLWDSRVEGLCGDCNRKKGDEMRFRNGTLAPTTTKHGQEWIAVEDKSTCVEPPPKPTECEDTYDSHCDAIINNQDFESCRQVVNYERYFQACQLDTCNLKRPACDSLATFAEACKHAGECIDWRTEICELPCPDEHVYEACREQPFEQTCDTRFDHRLTDEKAEGCFVNCELGEVVINRKCQPVRYCEMCFDEEAGIYREPSVTWVDEENPCNLCSCDARTLKIVCSTQECTPSPKPTCDDDCQFTTLKAGTSQCCPEYECNCDYESCPAQRPSYCDYGMVERQNITTTGCRPVYDCVCDLSLCVPHEITCEAPLVRKPIETRCCEDATCGCPDQCPPGTVKGDDPTFICEVGEEIQRSTDGCGCSIYYCVSRPVCVYEDLMGAKSVKHENETWTNMENPCLVYNCVKENEMFKTRQQNIITECLPCDDGYREEDTMDQCCPKCVLNDCIIETDYDITIYSIGDDWKGEGPCGTYVCEDRKGKPTIAHKETICPTVPETDCGFGYVEVCDQSQSQCCTTCSCEPEKVCLIGSEKDKSMPPGSVWKVDECTECTCTEVMNSDGFYETSCITTSCSPCPENYGRQEIAGECCGVCKPTRCVVQIDSHDEFADTPLEIGDSIRHKCDIIRCIDDGNGFGITLTASVDCPTFDIKKCIQQGGTVVYDQDGCCQECAIESKPCELTPVNVQHYYFGQCFTVEPISFTYCSGECGSGAYFHEETGQLIQRCTCCRPMAYQNRTVQAKCMNESVIDVTYTVITECSCDVNVTCSDNHGPGMMLAQPLFNAQGELIDSKSISADQQGGYNLGQIHPSAEAGDSPFFQEMSRIAQGRREFTAALRQCFDETLAQPSTTTLTSPFQRGDNN